MRHNVATGDVATDDAPQIAFYKENHNDEYIPFITFSTPAREDRDGICEDKQKDTNILTSININIVTYLKTSFISSSPLFQFLSILSSGYLTHATAFGSLSLGPLIAYSIVSTPGSLLFPHLAAAWNVGVFCGMSSPSIIPNYFYLTLLLLLLSIIWLSFLRYKILEGYGGRLGTTVFLATNLLLPALIIPTTSVNWAVYGAPTRTYPSSIAWQSALCTITASPFTAVLTLALRLGGRNLSNPVLAGNLSALLLTLPVVAIATSTFEFTDGLLEGVLIGSFVGMSGTDVIQNYIQFGAAGVLGAGWNLVFKPFFNGVVILGFEAMLGCALVVGGKGVGRMLKYK